MDAELKNKWLDALRSGRYAQGQGKLRAADKFCCLGVLCDLLHPTEWEPVDSDYSSDKDAQRITSGSSDGTELSPEELREAGIDDFVQATLVALNDGDKDLQADGWRIRPHTFAEIALFIDRNIKATVKIAG